MAIPIDTELYEYVKKEVNKMYKKSKEKKTYQNFNIYIYYMAEIVGIIAIITSIGSLCAIFGKTIKKSSCCGSNCETRTPQASTIEYIPPTPQPTPQIIRKNVVNEFSV